MLRFVKIILLALFVAVGLPLMIWAAGFIIFCGSVSVMMPPQSPRHLDAAIVLTGGTNRVEQGFDLVANGTVKFLLVSGVHKDVGFPDLKNLWGKKTPIDPSQITLGHQADNTIGNALEARQWVEHHHISSAYVITSNYHMARALVEFRHALPQLDVTAYPVEPQDFSPLHRIYWKTSFIEYHKLLITLYRVLLFPKETHPIPDSLRSSLSS